jgi:hypothetical protein
MVESLENVAIKEEQKICPSKEMWHYYNRSEICSRGITLDLILSSISDVIAGYHISYSATELLKDINCLIIKNNKKVITKKGKLILAHEMHERYHRGFTTYHVIINPYECGEVNL